MADSHTLPLIQEEIAKRAGHRLFSVLDLRHGFHQIEEGQQASYLHVHSMWPGPAMLMGLTKAPSFFLGRMEDVLVTAHPELLAFVSVYIDDIGEAATEQKLVALHWKQLNQVIHILDANELICGPKKGKLSLKSV